MPYLRIQTNKTIDADSQQQLLATASSKVSAVLGKSEQYVMVEFNQQVPLSFAGSTDPCAYLELKSINLPEQDTAQLAQALCELIQQQLQIQATRVYIEFVNAQRHLWGWNNKTF